MQADSSNRRWTEDRRSPIRGQNAMLAMGFHSQSCFFRSLRNQSRHIILLPPLRFSLQFPSILQNAVCATLEALLLSLVHDLHLQSSQGDSQA